MYSLHFHFRGPYISHVSLAVGAPVSSESSLPSPTRSSQNAATANSKACERTAGGLWALAWSTQRARIAGFGMEAAAIGCLRERLYGEELVRRWSVIGVVL